MNSGDDRVVIPMDLDGERADRALAATLERLGQDVSVREVRQAIRDKTIRIDGVRAPGDRVAGKAECRFDGFVARAATTIEADPILARTIPIIFEDEHLIALAKPSGLHTTPLASNPASTLLAAAVAHAPEVAAAGPPFEGGAVHRLDSPTSGVVLFAKDRRTRAELRAAFRAHEVDKTYAALVETPPADWIADTILRIDAPIRQVGDIVRVGDDADALTATSRVRVRAVNGAHAWVEVRTNYGRRHQVRAHLAYVGAPIVGDVTYGAAKRDDGEDWIALHAASVELADGRCFEAPWPERFRRRADELGLCE